MRIVEWLKKHVAVTILIIFAVYYLFTLSQSFLGVNLRSFSIPENSSYKPINLSAPSGYGSTSTSGISNTSLYPPREYTPQTDAENRLVIQESNLSLLVKDVTDTKNKIVSYSQTIGGYMVNSSVSNPQDAPTASVVIRVPSIKLEETLNYLHSLSIKVVSENLVGKDVTDQYVDIDKRIATLENTKSRYETILAEAKQISDITNLTQQILSTQNQIDSLKGQQISLEKNAELAKITIYLSTDEIALPYAPSETFRPTVIFKLAVRSLVGTLRGLAKASIWIGVYSAIWLPVLIVVIIIRKRAKRNPPQV